MTVKEIKTTKPRVKSPYNSTFGIQAYGDNNLYPQDMERHISASATGSGCLDRYATFIEGNGFNNIGFSQFVCNRYGETIDDVFHLIAQDLATHRGFAIHVYYDSSLRISEMQHVPFKACRLDEESEDGRVRFIAYHPDWSGSKTRNGKKLQVNKKTIQRIYTFNPNLQVVASQIAADGDLASYRGQILWVSMDGKFVYPKAIYDKCITSISTDEGIDNVLYRNARNNFLPAGMLVRRRGTAIAIDDDGMQRDTKKDNEEMQESLAVFQGDENTGSILDIEAQQEEDVPQWKAIESVNYDKKFTVTEESATEKIYAAFGQEPFYCLRKGKVGFSGEILNDAYNYYNSYVERERRLISRNFDKIFSNWNCEVNADGDYTIQPLILVKQTKEVTA